MSASLVGSEMCIRDRGPRRATASGASGDHAAGVACADGDHGAGAASAAVRLAGAGKSGTTPVHLLGGYRSGVSFLKEPYSFFERSVVPHT
eukprot:12729642-Alexandrium_andersonii.AAC.1